MVSVLVLVACGPVVSDGDSSSDDTSTAATDASTTTPSSTSASATDPSTSTASTTGTSTTEPTSVGTSTVGTTVDPGDTGDVATTDPPKLDIGSACGDGEINPGEQCDGDDLQGFDCESLGLFDGVLTCSDMCTFDTSDCSPSGCGDGVIGPGEQCDGGDLQGFDCESLGLGPGTLTCDPLMCTFDTSMCAGA